MIGDLFDSPWKVLILAVVILVLFGSRKLPEAARSLGKSMRILKTEIHDLHDDDTHETTVHAGSVPQPPPAQITQQQDQVEQLQRQIDELRKQAPAAPEPQQTHQAG